MSDLIQASVFLKREDLQQVRSFKIRGAYNKISSLNKKDLQSGIVCASAGNHAQGFAFSCQKLEIKGEVYMPATTPQQKSYSSSIGLEGIMLRLFWLEIPMTLVKKSHFKQLKETNKTFIHPFDDATVIEGQATVALEMLAQRSKAYDYLLVPIGGGGLVSGIITVLKEHCLPRQKSSV